MRQEPLSNSAAYSSKNKQIPIGTLTSSALCVWSICLYNEKDMWLVLIRHMWPSHWSLRLVTTDLSSLWGVKNQIKPSSQNQQRNKDWRDKSFILSNCFILIRNLEPLGTCRHGENMWNFAQTVIGAHDWTRSMIIYINSSKFSYMQRVVCLFKQKPLQVKLSKLWIFFFPSVFLLSRVLFRLLGSRNHPLLGLPPVPSSGL